MKNKRNLVEIIFGVFLILLGILISRKLTVYTFDIPIYLKKAIETNDVIFLIIAGVNLVILNSIRALPNYLGAFYVAESIHRMYLYPYKKAVPIICIIIIPIIYKLIYLINGVTYHIGLPAIALIMLVAYLSKENYEYVSLFEKSVLIITSIFGVQFLDISPILERLPVGKGEISMDVKLVSRFLGAEKVLTAISFLTFTILILLSIIFLFFIKSENNRKLYNELKTKNEETEHKAKLSALENRAYIEMKSLAHDLNSPLTAISGLVGIVKLSLKEKNLEKEFLYLDRAEVSIERLSKMIDEILDSKSMEYVSLEEIEKDLLSNISIFDYSEFVEVENCFADGKIRVNKIFFIRALINLLENSYEACSKTNARILVTIRKIENDAKTYAEFVVEDNGEGIKKDNLEKIFSLGYSSKNSYGFGLGFVKNVIDESKGTIYFKSDEGLGTTVIIRIEALDEWY